jgi:hypothetical protein
MDFADALLEGQRRLLREATAEREQALERIPLYARLWMAVTPGWTVSLAEKAGFPAGPEGVGRTLDDMVAQGLCTAMPILGAPVRDPVSGRLRPGSSERRYVMDVVTSRRIAGEVKQDPQRGADAVKQAIAAAGRAVLKASAADSVTAPDAIGKWAMLASQAEQPWELRRQLDAAVNEALAAGRLADAVMWIEAALPIEQLLPEEISSVVRLAGLRVQLRQRRADNERYLARFLKRPEQIEAFDELVEGPDILWALHYAGVGGVGKTMLMRYLEARVAPARKASTARIDFDHLNPQYPSTKPALLLLELAEELRLHDETGAAAGYFQSFSHRALAFHEGLTATDRPDRSALELIRDPQFQLLLNTFVSAAKLLPQPVILILDTCEELSKMLPDGSTPGAVAATFEILEGLQQQLPRLRVIFSGRRPLAASGVGDWSTRESHGPRHEPRPYLRLHEIRGFRRADAARYLDEKGECPKHLIPAILEQCTERGHVSQFSWASARTAPAAEPRYNPFELALYGAWAREDPSLTVDTIASTDVDQYVRIRIVGRIKNATVIKLLPAIAWLGRFDFGAVAALSGSAGEPARANELFEEIANQEWIDRQHARFLEVERGLRPRLLAYFRMSDATATEAARQACAAYLERLTLDHPFGELDVSSFEAMLRVVMADPEHAARWWEAVEERVRASGTYAWIRAVTTRLLGEDNWPEAVMAGPHIRAAILATHAAALIHARESSAAEEVWSAAEEASQHYPIESGTRRLRLRAICGQGVIPGFSPGEIDEPLAATLVGGLERHIDGPEAKGPAPEIFVRLVAVIDQAGQALELRAFARVLAGRALVRAGRSSEAASLFTDALALRAEFGETTQRWLDWRAPDDLSSRLAIEFLSWAYPAELSPRECLSRFDGPPVPRGLDADRFAAALLLLEGAERPPQPNINWQAIEHSRTLGLSAISSERTISHQLYPPLYVAVAEEMALRREIAQALEILQAHSSAAESSSVAYDEVLASDRALMRIFRRLRLMDEGYRARDSVLSSEAPDDHLLCAALNALAPGPDVQAFHRSLPSGIDFRQEPAAVRHVRWNTLGVWPRELSEAGLAWAAVAFSKLGLTPETGFSDLSCALDVAEIREVARALGQPEPGGLMHDLPDVASWWRSHPTQPVEGLTLGLRATALGFTEGPRVVTELLERVGRRRAATIALDEGELLALRLPARSLWLLNTAHALFSGCGDRLQAWIAQVCASLALARLGRSQNLTPPLEAATVACGQELWVQVIGLVENGRAIEDPWLRPWLLRVAACVAFERDRDKYAGRMARVAAAWSKLASPPAEVSGWLDARTPETARGAPSMTEQEATRSWGMLSFASIRRRLSASIFEPGEIEVRYGMDGDGGRVARLSVGAVKSEAPYRMIRAELHRPLVGLLEDESNPGVRLLYVDPFSAWVPWEFILAGTKGSRPPLTRVTRGAWNFPWRRRRAERLTAHTLTLNHAGADLGGSVWKLAPWSYAYAPRELLANLAPGDAQILHVIADPIETRAGVRLRLSEQMFTEASQTERGLLLRSEEILKILPNVEFCVLQLPLATRRGRTGVDREKAGLLRVFAAELHEQGMPTVVTVPALHFQDGVAVLQEFAGALQEMQGSGSPAGLAEATGRAMLALMRLGETEESIESAFDICFYRGFWGG